MMNADKPLQWKPDIQDSVAQCNLWFLEDAPADYRSRRAEAIASVKAAFAATSDMHLITPDVLKVALGLLAGLRMSTLS